MADSKILTVLDEKKIEADLKLVLGQGIKSIAIVLMHSCIQNKHETIIGDIAKKLGY